MGVPYYFGDRKRDPKLENYLHRPCGFRGFGIRVVGFLCGFL